LVLARGQAQIYASEVESFLTKNKTSTTRYVTWFGPFLDTRFNTVLSHFTSLSNAWDNAGVTFYCNCKQPYYAYVYPTKPYNIYLCKYFWLAPMAGTDSKGGTLIHEMSHFY
jgi:peptidyl-Lys metalloendopeptidase